MRRRARPVETTDYLRAAARFLRGAGRRVADADPEDLAELLALRQVLDEAIATAVTGQREQWGRSWADIARAAGTTRQAAHERWGPPTTKEDRPDAGAQLDLTDLLDPTTKETA